MRKLMLVFAAIAALAIPAAASAAVVPVTSLTGDWSGTGSVAMTDYGVHFDVGAGYPGADVKYVGYDGTLASFTDLTYTARYNTTDLAANTAPYLRVYLNTEGGLRDVIYDPSSEGINLSENENHTRNVLTGQHMRYDDDCGNGAFDSTETDSCMPVTDGDASPYGIGGTDWATMVADHGNESVAFIAVTQGWQWGEQNEAMLTRMRVNSDEFIFGATGPAGPTGDPGSIGATGSTGSTGAAAALADPPAPLTVKQNLVGDSLRVLHAHKRVGTKLGTVRAWLMTPAGAKKLPVRNKAIQADLTGKPVGNYNVRIKATYVRKDGSKFTRVTFRNLSVTVLDVSAK